jgi:hypothetical protein
MLQLTKTLHFECARPGATEAGKCQGEKNPVWARVSLGHSVIWYSNLLSADASLRAGFRI